METSEKFTNKRFGKSQKKIQLSIIDDTGNRNGLTLHSHDTKKTQHVANHLLGKYFFHTHYHYSSLYSVNSFIANVICYIAIPSLNKVLYFVSCR